MDSRLVLAVGFALISVVSFRCESTFAKEGEKVAKLPQQAVEYLFDLDSEDFNTREKATQELPQYGEPVIEPLQKITRGDSLEAAIRAILVLEQIYASGKEESVAKAEDTLDLLTKARNPSVATRAKEAIGRNAVIWEKRAVVKIREFGGKVKLWTAKDIAKAELYKKIIPGQVRYVVLGAKWNGNEKGLRYITRISNLEILYVINGHPLKELALEDLMKAMPTTRFQSRDSDAMLGISSNFQIQGGGCFVKEVSEGLAAQKAGIKPGDIIVQFDGTKVENFDFLVDLIGKREAGDTVDVVLYRDSRLITLKVTLSSWLDK